MAEDVKPRLVDAVVNQTAEAGTVSVQKGSVCAQKRAMNPNSLANLRPYPNGVSGNPAGRPKRPLRPYTDATDEQLNNLAPPAMRQALEEALSYCDYEKDENGEYVTAPIKDKDGIVKDCRRIPIRRRYPKLPEDLTVLQCRTMRRELAKQGLTKKFDLKIDELDVHRRQGLAPEIVADQETEPIDPDDLEAWMKS